MQKHWEGYQKAIEKPYIYPLTDSTIGVSGFLDLKPKPQETKPLASSDFGIDKTPNLFNINNTNVR
jgi:hypothetical protein